MAITYKIFDTRTLLGLMREAEPVSRYFRDLAFGRTMLFNTQKIDFEKISDIRKIAPFVVPTAQGVPIYEQASQVQSYKPSYIKLLDTVTPQDHLVKRAGELAIPSERTPLQRMNASVVDITMEHKRAIDRQVERMAAEAVLTGKVTIEGEHYPDVIVDFQRDAANTITLTGTATWDDPNADIIGDLNAWIRQMHLADHGGAARRLTLGANVAEFFQNNTGVREQLDTQVRGTQADLTTGIIAGEDVVWIGRLGQLDVYVYRDYYRAENGTLQDLMDPDTVLLSASAESIQGVEAYGAILDVDVMKAMEIHAKMYKTDNPSALHILSESSPLLIPVNPNATLLARVLD